MLAEKQKKQFDEVAKEGAEYLLEQFWVLRDREPEKYQLIREREHALRNYFLDKMGYRLIVHRHFAKLEKIPVRPESWMGIADFKEPRDYALFCCLLAYLEGKSLDDQFLLSDLCEELQALFPGEDALDWTHYEHRKSLVRVLRFSENVALLRLVDGNVEEFSLAENHEVLYEVPVVSRYFMRSYPKDLFQFENTEDILQAEWSEVEGEQKGVKRRHRVYRQLFLSPVMYSQGVQDEDFLYLRNFRPRIREDIEKHTDFQFELYKNAAMLTLQERKNRFDLYPANKAINDIALQFADLICREQQEDDIPLQFDGSIGLTQIDFARRVELCKKAFGKGWSKQYREASISETAKDLFNLLAEWKMVSKDQETGIISLKPLMARVVGRYPKDYMEEIDRLKAEGNEVQEDGGK